MSFFDNGKYKISFNQIPLVSNQNILFIHGNLSSNTWWQPTLEYWNKNKGPGSLVFAEWRGCGGSDGPLSLEDLKVENLALDYINLLEHLKINKTHLVGHSTGGIIALKALSLRPELFEKVVLLDPVAPWGFQAPPELMAAFKQMQSDKNFCAMVMGSTIYGNDANSELFKKIVDDAFNVHPLIWQGIPEVLSKIDFKSELSKIKHPVLILHGEFDQILSKKDSEELNRLLPNSTYKELKAQGHSCNVENPKLFVQLTQKFLQ
ncbi:MAG: alpha/beta hydrolase [Oligoflexia bacterium]|nr:alpha/beta hydrolase [Oligoflexia bacterium]